MSGKDYEVKTGSATPEKTVSNRTDGPAGGKGPKYDPAAAASCLREQGTEGSAPNNKGPMGG